MPVERRVGPRAIGRKYQPHWFWAVSFVFVPVCLLVLAFFGVLVGSTVPLEFAALAPKIALGLALAGFATALLLRRRVPIQIAALGLTVTAAGLLLLVWLSA